MIADDAQQTTSLEAVVLDVATMAIADPNRADQSKMLDQAIADDDVESVRSLLISSAALLDEPVDGDWNAPPLIVAAATSALQVTKLLLARGADASALLTESSVKLEDMDDTGCTALHVAAYAGHAHVVEALLQAKPDLVSVLTEKQRSALYFAARFGHVAVIQTLLQLGADLGVCEVGAGESTLSVAAEFGQIECVRALLLDHQVSVHTKNEDGSTALHQAATEGHVDVMEELLQHGAHVDEPDNDGSTPLHWSATHGQAASARILLEHNANIHATMSDCNDSTALHQAAAEDYADVVEVLLHNGASVDAPDGSGLTPLHWAGLYGQPECARLLLQNNASVHAVCRTGSTALHQAVSNGHVDVIQVLLRHGALVEQDDFDSATPLHWAAIHDESESARVLLEHNANVHAMLRTRKDATALHIAAAEGHVDVMEVLLCHGNGSAPLHLAASEGHGDVMEVLLSYGARVDELDRVCYTALHWSALYGQLESARVLLQHSADVHVKSTINDSTALYLAVLNRQVEIAQGLLAAGAIATPEDIKLAKDRRYAEIVAVLEQ